MLMFVHIFYTFCKMLILTVMLILSFSIVFYMTFSVPDDVFSVSPLVVSYTIETAAICFAEISIFYSWSSHYQDYDNDYRRV